MYIVTGVYFYVVNLDQKTIIFYVSEMMHYSAYHMDQDFPCKLTFS